MHLLVVLIPGWLIFMMHQKKVMRKGATRAELSTFTLVLKQHNKKQKENKHVFLSVIKKKISYFICLLSIS